MFTTNDTTETTDSPSPAAANGSLRRRRMLRYIIVIAICAAFFMISSPQSVPSPLLIVGFSVLALLLYNLWRLLLLLTGLEDRLGVGSCRSLLLTGTLLPVLLLMMQSIGQLTVRDVLTLCGLFAIGLFYVSRVRS